MCLSFGRREFTAILVSGVFGSIGFSDAVTAQSPTVVHEIDNPGTGSGLAWDGENLWTNDERNQVIYEVSPDSGSTISEFSISFSPDGLGWDGNHLWSADGEKLYQIDPTNGGVVNKIKSPDSGSAGLAWDGEYLWLHTYTDNGGKIKQFDIESQEVLKTFESPEVTAGQRADLGWYNGFVWLSDGDWIYQIDAGTSNGNVVNRHESQVTFSQYSLAWDSSHLWEAGNNQIKRLDMGDIGTGNSRPNAAFIFSPANPIIGERVTFDASDSSDSDGFIEKYEWDFDGDGLFDARGGQVTVTFDESGEYTATLRVTDDNGATATTKETITIAESTGSASPTSTERPSSTPTETPSPTNSVTSTSTSAPTPAGRSTPASGGTEQETEFQRGFFFNNSESSLSFLTNPFLLTISGFLLSVLGIVYQLTGRD